MHIDFSHFPKDEFIEALYKSWKDNIHAINIAMNTHEFEISYDDIKEIISFRISIPTCVVILDSTIKDYINANISFYGDRFEKLFNLDFSKLIEIYQYSLSDYFKSIEIHFLYSLSKEEKDTLYALLKIQGYLQPITIPSSMFENCTDLKSISFPKNLFYNKKI